MIETERLRLRPWRLEDSDALASMHVDAEVMQDYGGPISRALSDSKLARYAAAFEEYGFCRWLLETRGGEFLGYCGVMPAFPGHPLGDHFEIGWRMVRGAWGHGYATEAAKAALPQAFARSGLSEILSYTAPDNLRSQAVMSRLELQRDEDRDFVGGFDTVSPWRGLVWVARPG